MEQLMIPDDIFQQICQFLTTGGFIKMRQLSKHHKKLVSEMPRYKYMYVKNEMVLRHIIDNYKFLNLKLYEEVTDEEIKELKNCHILDLSFCKNVTDEGVKGLKKCHTIDLMGTKVTKECIKKIKESGCMVRH